MWDFKFAINRSIKSILLAVSLILLTSCADPEKPPSEETKAQNLKPIAVIFPSSEQSIFVGDTLTFKNAGSADPDSNATLRYNWYITDTTTPGSSQILAVTEQIPVQFTQTGIVTLTLVVTDELGLESDPVSVTVIVNPLDVNRAPNGIISYTIGEGAAQSNDNLSVITGTGVLFTGSATDPDNDPIASLVWAIPDGVTVDNTPSNLPFTASFTDTGIYNIFLTATDDGGAVDETPARITVTVTDAPVINQKPIAVISPPMDKTILVGDTLLFTGDGSSDPDANTVLNYVWTFETTQNTGVTSTQFFDVNPGSIAFLNAGTVVVTLVVTDSTGMASDPAMMTVTVNEPLANQKPIARIVPSTATTIAVGNSISFMGNTSSDPDNNTPLSFLWTFTGAATSIPDSTLENPPIAFNQVDVVTVTLVVTDSTGLASDPAFVTITVNANAPPANQKPIAVISPSTDKTIMVNDSINFSGVFSSDPDANTVLKYTWTFETTTTAGLSLTQTVNGAVPGNTVFRNAGSVVVSLVVMDSANLASDPASIIVTVNAPAVNQRPIARITPPTATTITTGDSIAFMGNTSSDPDGNNPLSYVWTFVTSPINGLPPAPTTTTEINPNVSFSTAGTVDVSLVVTDSLGLASTNSTNITITVSDALINQQPIARITPPTATTITTGDVIAFIGDTSSDPDGIIPLTYDWTFISTPAAGTPTTTTSNAINPNVNFSVAVGIGFIALAGVATEFGIVMMV